MSYLLLIPLFSYVTFGVITYQNHGRSDAGRLIGGFLIGLTFATVGQLISGTASNPAVATVGAVLHLLGNGAAILCLPFIPLALSHGRLPIVGRYSGWWPVAASGAIVMASFLAAILSAGPLVRPVYPADFGVVPVNDQPVVEASHLVLAAEYVLLAALALFSVVRGYFARHLEGWQTPAALLTLLVVPVLGHGMGMWAGFLLPALGLTYLLTRYVRLRPLRETLRAMYAGRLEALLVLDGRGRAIWQNAEAERFFGTVLDCSPLNPALLFSREPYASMWQWIESMPTSQAVGEFEAPENGTLSVSVEDLPPVGSVRRGRIVRLAKAPNQLAAPGSMPGDPLRMSGLKASIGVDVQTVMADALEMILNVTGLDIAIVYLRHNSDPNLMRLAGSYYARETGFTPPEVISIPDSLAGAAVLQGRTVVFEGLDGGQRDKKPHYRHLREYGIRAGLATPLVARGQTPGVLTFFAVGERTFSDKELLLLEGVGRQLGAAYDSATLHAAENRQRVQAEVLNDIVSAMAGAASLDDALQVVMEHLRRVIDHDSAAIALFSDGHSAIRVWRGFPHPTRLTELMPLAELPVYQHLVEHKTVLCIEDTHKFPLWRKDILGGPRIRSAIIAPLVVRSECIGALSVDSDEVAHFSEEDAQVVERLANHLSFAIENLRLLDEAHRRTEKLAALNELAAVTSASLEFEAVLNTALKTIVELTRFESASIYMRDETGEGLVQSARYDMLAGLPGKTVAIRPGEGISSEVLRTGKAVVTTDYQSHPLRLSSAPDIRTFVGVPLVAKGEVIGTLALVDRQTRNVADDDLELVVSIGQQLGIAIDNARLYEMALARARTAAQLSFLGVQLTASLNLTEALELICQHALNIFSIDGAYVWLVEGDQLVGAAGIGIGHDQVLGFRLDMHDEKSLAVRVVRDGKPVYVNDAADKNALVNRRLFEIAGGQSVLGAPLFREKESIGALVLLSTQHPRRFSSADIEPAKLLSAHAALAIDNARLFEESKRQVRQLRLVQEVSRDVTSYLDLDLLLEVVSQRLWLTFGYYSVLIAVRQGDELAVRAHLKRGQSLNVGVETPVCVPKEDGIIYTSARGGEPILAADVAKEPLFKPSEVLPETKAELAVPLILAGEVLGVLDVQSERAEGLTQADLELLEPLAAQIAISLSNAQLFQTVRDYTAELEMRVGERTRRIREQQERTDAILHSVGDGVVVVNLDGEIVLTNPVVEGLLDSRGQSPLLAERLRQFLGDLGKQAEPGSARRLEVDGLTLEAHTSRLVEDGRVQGTVIVLHDVTHLYEVDRLKSQFVSTVSHELRTPLSNLKLYLELLQGGKPERQQEYYNTMHRELGRLENLIESLLDLSRLDSQHPSSRVRQPVNLNEILRLVMVNHEPQAQARRITLQASLDETLPYVLADRNQMIQVLTNLVANALNYTPEEGSVWLHTATRSVPDESQVLVTVEDTGLGISADEVDRIFDRFYRGKNARILGISGSGLGLAIVKEIVEMHGGQVSVSSAVGVGSTFTLALPVPPPGQE